MRILGAIQFEAVSCPGSELVLPGQEIQGCCVRLGFHLVCLMDIRMFQDLSRPCLPRLKSGVDLGSLASQEQSPL